ncbi:MAG: hypothetical protein ACTSYS_09140 [Promethearchaeota archaeon]
MPSSIKFSEPSLALSTSWAFAIENPNNTINTTLIIIPPMNIPRNILKRTFTSIFY